MADNEKDGELAPSRGADWEVVSLTASTYAAAPGPTGVNPDPDDERKNKEDDRSGKEASSAMFMSEHFVFPPNEHENLPIELGYSEIRSEVEGQDESPGEKEDDGPEKAHEESREVKLDDDPEGTQFFDNGSTFSIHGMEFVEAKDLQALYLVGDEQGRDVTTELSTFRAETGRSGPISHLEGTDTAEPDGCSNENLDSQPKHTKQNEDKDNGSGLPCEAWWKRHVASLYHHAKEANTFWSIFVAAALTGIVILGKKWQRDKWHLHENKWRFGINDEKTHRMLGPIGRFKHFIMGSHQRSPLNHGGAAANL